MEVGDICYLKSKISNRKFVYVWIESQVGTRSNMESKIFEEYTTCLILGKNTFSRGNSICKIYIGELVGWVYSDELTKDRGIN